MIAGLEEITSGELLIDGKLVNDIAPKDRDIAMVFQNYALYPHMTVFENMAFGLKLRKTPKGEIKKRVTEAARILEIEHLLDPSIDVYKRQHYKKEAHTSSQSARTDGKENCFSALSAALLFPAAYRDHLQS